ncbi:subclass B1 metallo-beta-lactamase [Flagellimonas myxillae]|uniref:subclass B1 metallo-beta-lactamase n=1 Tax=Flagellimonas myxillae TaxID=2942214 RepID=UPI00201F0225|nr:subclass B1 metallo-beta-lactamase [Muricauda myxillae]MCL6265733.1 subclass B1 metallo-beta-lactamase [Muricauda myxillae]
MKFKFLYLFLLIFCIASCKLAKNEVVYKTDNLEIHQLTSGTYVHVSFLQTESFGKVGCNGLLYRNGNDVLIFDTPISDEVSQELLAWIASEWGANVVGVVPTHAHEDCLAGLNTFHESGINSYANQRTQQLAREKGFPIPLNGFQDKMEIEVGNQQVLITFIGEGHTEDNIVGYIPEEQVLFGGCLLKSLGAGKGYIEEANLGEWPHSIEKIKKEFSTLQFVVPGHGKPGGKELLDFTQTLFLDEKEGIEP